MTVELIEQAFCVFDWQAAAEFSFDGRSHIQFQLLWSLPARQTKVQAGIRTRAAAGVILSLLSHEQNEYLRLEVSHIWFTPSTLIALIVLFAGLINDDWGADNDCWKMLVRLRVSNIRVEDTWVDTEGAGDWHMYIFEKAFK